MTIKVAIIGCGSIAMYRHAPEYANNPHVEIAAVYDRNPDRAERLVNMYGGRVVSRYEDIINDPTIDAVSDCSTNEMHHVITTAALRSGKHVLCEKPIATTLEGAEQMLRAAQESGKILMIDHNQRLAAAHQRAREILRSGELGRVLSFKTNFGHKGPEYWSANKTNGTWFFKKARSALGVAGDLGIHKVDLLRFLLDDEIVEVSAYADALHKKDEYGRPIEVCDNMVCLLRTESGAIGTASFSWTYYGEEDNSTILYCENGIMKIYTDPLYQIEITKGNAEIIRYQLGKLQTNDNQTNSGVIDAFVDCIMRQTPPPITGEDGLLALRIIQAAVRSAEEGISIKLR
jgi:predicted dehydrogenase